jgi:hypothetical protein
MRVTGFELQGAGYQLPVTGCGLRVPRCGLRGTGSEVCELLVAGYRFPVSSGGVVHFRIGFKVLPQRRGGAGLVASYRLPVTSY